MEALAKYLDAQLGRTKDLKDFCNIVCDENQKYELLLMAGEIKEVNAMLAKCNSILKANPERFKEVKRVNRELRRQDVIMKMVLDKMGNCNAKDTTNTLMVTPVRQPISKAPMSSVKKLQWDKRTTAVQPPPSSAKKDRHSTMASMDDFAYSISEKEFNQIPKYLRGREQLADLQRSVDEVICPCLIEKYALLNRASKDVATFNLRQLKKHFEDQESYFPGHYFITDGDIARYTQNLIDKRLRQRIQMLRQLGLIKEMRKNSTSCYMWMIRVEK